MATLMAGAMTMPAAAEDLRAAVEDMEHACWREGIEPDGPLGVWVTTMRRGLQAFATLVETQSDRVEGTVGGARKLVEAEIGRLRLTNEVAIRAMNEATVTFNRSKIDAEKMSLKTINDLTPKLLQEIREGVIIRERRHNRGVEWRRAIMAITAALSLVIGGYAWRSFQSGGDTGAAIMRCMKAPLVANDGKRYCPFTTLFPELAEPKK